MKEAIYVHSQDPDFAPEKKRKEPEKVAYPFCQVHSSHFCPCVKPKIYRGRLTQARAEWDAWLKEKEAKRGSR